MIGGDGILRLKTGGPHVEQKKAQLVAAETISDHPKCAAGAYGEFRRDLRLWKEFCNQFYAIQLVSNIAMSADGASKMPLVLYLEETNDTPSKRNIESLISRLDNEFASPAQETVIQKNERNDAPKMKQWRRHSKFLGYLREIFPIRRVKRYCTS